MNELKNYHPLPCFLYFVAMIILSVIFMHPIFIMISFFGGALYSAVSGGIRRIKQIFCLYIPLILASCVINPLFSHEGATIIAYFKSGNPFTLESVIYGGAAGGMIASVMLWFSIFCETVTSDKLIYLSSRLSPNTALVFSMALRTAPALKKNYADIKLANNSLGIPSKGFRAAVQNLSALLTMTLENSVETAASMKSRGFGCAKRTAYSIFKFTFRDAALIAVTITAVICICAISTGGTLNYTYFPVVSIGVFSPLEGAALCAYAILSLLPVLIELKEAAQWAALKRKI